MAYNVQQINPLDLQPSVGIGVGLPFSSNQVFNTTYTTKDAIKANLINYFLTGKLERYFNPNLGAGLRAVLFEQTTQDNIDQVEYIVQTGINTWFPNIIINQLTVEAEPDTHTVTLFLRYSIANTNIEDEILINFEQ
jgi:phage baseplate assembly protein W